MASIAKEPNGRRRILFAAPDGKRKTIRLGKVSQRAAEAIRTKVELLLASQISGCGWDNETARWVADLPDELAHKLAAVALIPGRQKATLASFLDRYIEKRSDVKSGTQTAYGQGRDSLVEFFGAEKDLRSIHQGDAEEFMLFLKEKGYADATVSRRIKHAKQFFSAAVRRRLIASDPFAEVKAGSQENKARFYFVSLGESYQVLDACPNAEWRLIFALGRFGGLRCPSELLALQWPDIDWERDRFTVRSSKTEHHANKASRVVPLFPELRPYLEAVFEEAEPGSRYVITTYRDTNINLRVRLERIIYRAGLIPWPRLFQNLRSSRETELTERFPVHVVCQWIGNSVPVAAKHYLQVTDDHFEQALQQAAQIPAQYVRVSDRTARDADGRTPVFPVRHASLRHSTNVVIGPEGFEPPTKGL
jgi:integrase